MTKSKLFKTIALALALSSVGLMTANRANAAESYWKLVNNSWYYIDSSGKVTTGWIKDNGYWYYLDSNGVMKTGWVYDNGNWYYCWSNGQMATDTTIDGYYVNSSGAWTTSRVASSSGSALTSRDLFGTHHIRQDISQRQEDINASDELTNYNMTLSEQGKTLLRGLSNDVASGRTTLDEIRSCIGKVVDSKYKITDVKYFEQVFPITTGNSKDNKIKAVKGSNLSNYNSSSAYKYDSYLIFSCGNSLENKWDAIRIVVEFEEV